MGRIRVDSSHPLSDCHRPEENQSFYTCMAIETIDLSSIVYYALGEDIVVTSSIAAEVQPCTELSGALISGPRTEISAPFRVI